MTLGQWQPLRGRMERAKSRRKGKEPEGTFEVLIATVTI